MEKQTVQRDFGVKGSIDEKPLILAPEIICSLPGGSDEIGGDGDVISGDAIGIEERWVNGLWDTEVGLRDVRPTPGDVSPGSGNIKQPGDGI